MQRTGAAGEGELRSPVHSPRLISSMATRQLLAELADLFVRSGGVAPQIESVGGVDAARRVRDGEPVDEVMLASSAIEDLERVGAVQPNTRLDVVRSAVAVAVASGHATPALDTVQDVLDLLQGSQRIAYSTGPSGTHLLQLLDRWEIRSALESRLVQTPPGVPVAHWVATGQASVGFQQRSELVGQPGITVLGDLPPQIAGITTFSLARSSKSRADPVLLNAWRAFIVSPTTAEIKRRLGMEPVL